MELQIIKLNSNLDLLKDFPVLKRYLTLEEIQSVTRCNFQKDRNLKLVSRIGLKYFLSELLSLPMEEIYIKHQRYGKLFLENKELEFNVTHSDNMILYGFDHNRIGIDIEKMNPIPPETAEIFMSLDEWIHFTSLRNSQDKIEFFYKIWTAKESLFKAIGTGITNSMFLLTNKMKISFYLMGTISIFIQGKFTISFTTLCVQLKIRIHMHYH